MYKNIRELVPPVMYGPSPSPCVLPLSLYCSPTRVRFQKENISELCDFYGVPEYPLWWKALKCEMTALGLVCLVHSKSGQSSYILA